MPYCPRDHSLLSLRGDGLTHFHLCVQCGGVWIHQSALVTVKGDPTDRLKKYYAAEVTGARISTGTIPCPGDGRTMTRIVKDGVEIDQCEACDSVWLDHGELEILVAAFRQRHPSTRPARLGKDLLAAADSALSLQAGDLLASLGDLTGEALVALLDGW